MERQGGEGVGWVGRYLWYTTPSEKGKRKIWKHLNVDEEDQREVSR